MCVCVKISVTRFSLLTEKAFIQTSGNLEEKCENTCKSLLENLKKDKNTFTMHGLILFFNYHTLLNVENFRKQTGYKK